ncbi:MAG: DUF2207 domain-containing protein [Candidatus ainarchaeum sp.]|nr:DUF2207 domain-containing protein [Candidatus ainarchaeum sp.]
MKHALALFVLALLAGAASSFSIDSYYTHATVLPNGDLEVQESMNFTLEQAYSEGFRSIRKEDFGTLDNIVIRSVKVNGAAVPYVKQLNEGKAEIVWQRTYEGANAVELDYVLKDRAQLYDDFAKICFEHYGANWAVPATAFQSRMTLPEAARGKDMHYEVYSAKKGSVNVDDLSIVISISNVPSGNYVGGCYLYDKAALSTTNRVNGSALQILKDERKAYGSQETLAPEEPGSITLCCLPLALLLGAVAALRFAQDRKIPKLPESILPPDNEEPAVVSALVRNEVSNKGLVAATILDLINRNILDIVELEKKGREASATIERERTILMLKKRPAGLKPYENAVIDMIFSEGRKEADLDQMAADFDRIKTKAEAENTTIAKNVKIFGDEVDGILKAKGVLGLKNKAQAKMAGVVMLAVFGAFLACAVFGTAPAWFMGYIASGNWFEVGGTLLSFIILIPAIAYLAIHYFRPSVPDAMRNEYAKWDAFARAVSSSRLKEYPPSSAVIWGGILVYATALEMTDKVKKHFSELDTLTANRLQKLDTVRTSSYTFYTAAWAVHNLGTYGSRSGPSGGHGGFSSASSGGWSGGGGGFSGGSSGGGGFR